MYEVMHVLLQFISIQKKYLDAKIFRILIDLSN